LFLPYIVFFFLEGIGGGFDHPGHPLATSLLAGGKIDHLKDSFWTLYRDYT